MQVFNIKIVNICLCAFMKHCSLRGKIRTGKKAGRRVSGKETGIEIKQQGVTD